MGGGGGGGIVIQNNYTTNFVTWYGPPNPQNKFTFTVGARANGGGNNSIIGMHTLWKTYNSSGAVTSTTTVYQGGYGACNCSAPGGAGGSGGGGAAGTNCVSAANCSQGGQGNCGGSGVAGTRVCSCGGPCIMFWALGGGGGGYSSAGSSGSLPNTFCPAISPGSGGTGLNISAYLSPYLQTTLSMGNSVLSSAGYSGYSTLWASSGGGASGTRGACNPCYQNAFGAASGGPGAGSGNSPNASGWGCGGGGAAYYGGGGYTGGGLVVVSYAGKPATNTGLIIDYDSAADKTYHVIFGPPQDNYTYTDYALQF